jgi:two-component system, OmpR family, sensor kinase
MALKLNSLGTRITLLVLAFCVAISAIFAAAMFYAQSQFYYETRQRQAVQFADNVVKSYPNLSKLSTINREEVEDRFEQLLLLDPAGALYLVDGAGQIVARHSKESSGQRLPTISLAPITQLMDQSMGRVVLGDDPDFPGQPCLFGAAPLNYAGTQTGYLYVIMRPQENYVRELLMTSYANRSALGIAIGAALLSALMVWALLSLLTRPLRQLTAAADAIKQAGGESSSVALPHAQRGDEIGRLSRAFGSLLDRLADQFARIKRMDATRREWVASISHDLRTPLTSLTGHLETVQLRGAQMTEAQRAQFIDTALKNAKHIDRLSASLLDFARLDSDDVPLDKAPTPIGELLDDLAARFAPKAQERGIKLYADYPPGMTLVTVDNGLIERAVANLVDNALRYTPAGGIIRLGAEDSKRWLMLSVCDTGPGIAQEDLPHIFERFYQSKQQREGHGHAGLGLAIVKRIAELHGGNVSAQNRPKENGGGAKFIVALPRSKGSTQV